MVYGASVWCECVVYGVCVMYGVSVWCMECVCGVWCA